MLEHSNKIIQVRESVSQYSIERMKKRRESLTREQELEQEQQMPRITNCLSSLRRLYLNPGVDMTPAGDHPESIRNPRLPLKPNSSMKWCHGKYSDLWNLHVWIKGIS